MPERWRRYLHVQAWVIAVQAATVVCLAIISIVLAVRLSSLASKHNTTMQMLRGLEKLAIEQQYQDAESLFLVNIKTAANQREKIRADAEYRAFKGKYPNATVYDSELRRLRQYRRNDSVPSASQR